MRIALFILPCAALGILVGVMVAGVKKGTNIFKLPAVAWMITGVMVVIAIGIGIEKTEGSHVPEPAPTPGSGLQQGPGSYPSYVRDDANVLSAQTERELAERNQRLWERHNVTVAVVTCNYPAGVPDCNGHSSVFDGVAYPPGGTGSRDTCVMEADGTEGIWTAVVDMELLRRYRREEVHGNAYRHPRKYRLLCAERIEEPFVRKDYRD